MADSSMTQPDVSSETLAEVVAERYGIHGSFHALPGEWDLNFRVDAEDGVQVIVKVAHPASEPDAFVRQDLILDHLAEADPELPVPRLVRALDGGSGIELEHPDGILRIRVISMLMGRILARTRPHDPTLLREVGETLARLDCALRPLGRGSEAGRFDRPEFEWNLLSARERVRNGLSAVADARRRDVLERLLDRIDDTVGNRLEALPKSLIHNDANDYNLLVERDADGVGHLSGVIDFGDALRAPRIVELAVAVAYLMLGKRSPLLDAARVVAGYHAVEPLTEDELDLVHSLSLLRLGLSVTQSALRSEARPDDPYLKVSEAPAWEMIERLTPIGFHRARAVYRNACEMPPCPNASAVVQWIESNPGCIRPVVEPPLDASTPILDLSVGSLELGSLDMLADVPAFTESIFERMRRAEARVAIGRYDEPRLCYTAPAFAAPLGAVHERRTIHMGVDLFLDAGAPVFAPLDGTVKSVRDHTGPLDYGPTVILEHAPADGILFHTLYGHLSRDVVKTLEPGRSVAAGERIGSLGESGENGGWPPHLHMQLITDLLEDGEGRAGDFPGVAPPSEREVWRSLSPDPSVLLGAPPETRCPPTPPIKTLLKRRSGRLGPSLSVSYRRPLHIVRGHRQHLFDVEGYAYLDGVNNVAHVGHAHPTVREAGARQMAVLNTNTRYLHETILRYGDALVGTLPDPLRVCYFVNSGSEANELALRLAQAHTSGTETVVVQGAYHGNSGRLIGISPYKHDGPGGAGPPASTWSVPIPDDFRGPYRRNDPDRGARYAEHVRDALEEISTRGGLPMAFICESLLGCGGQIELPEGYLKGAYAAARTAGAVCIADEVQVGFGRTGSHFWGFEHQGVVPDIVTMGKPIGNGHPLGAVITTPAIARSFANGMEYFNTFGGNPVSCAIGLAVLDVIREEGLQKSALDVGRHLSDRLHALSEAHSIMGDVRGRGLFLGIECVLNRQTLEPAALEARYIVERMRDRGILLSTDGPYHNVIKIKPPLTFDRDDADRLVDELERIVREDVVLARIGL